MSEVPVAISYSGGASSEWLVEAIARGAVEAPKTFAVFFADTGGEHGWTYAAVNEVEERVRSRGGTFIRCKAPGESLPEHIVNSVNQCRSRMSSPPLWTRSIGGGRGRLAQKCTREWKTRPLRRAQSAWLRSIGAPKRVVSWIGFGFDEQHRATKAVAKRDVKWETFAFPAIGARRVREQQRDDLREWTGRAPQFSMCTFCPFKSVARWKATEGTDLAQALEVEDAIGRVPDSMKIDDDLFLSDRLVKIGKVREMPDDDAQGELFDAPGCDGGRCFL